MNKKFLLAPLLFAFGLRLSADPVIATSYTATAGNYPDDSGIQLIDSVYNSFIPGVSLANDSPPNPYAGYDWVGWDNRDAQIVFQFGSVVTINTVTIHSILWTGAGVYLPGQIQVNGDSFNVAADGFTGFTNFDGVTLNFAGNWTGSTLTLDILRAPSAGTWMFADEISFANSPRPNGVPDTGATLLYTSLGLLSLSLLSRRKQK